VAEEEGKEVSGRDRPLREVVTLSETIQSRLSSALNEGSVDSLCAAFAWLARTESAHPTPDWRDTMINLTPFIDCARRLGKDPAQLLGPIAERDGAEWFRQTFTTFVARSDVTLSAFGWSLVETPTGRAYRFAWPS
jgi:hypothetical protein